MDESKALNDFVQNMQYSASQIKRGEKTAQRGSQNQDLLPHVFRGIKSDLVSSWGGMSQLSQITIMFVVNLKSSFKRSQPGVFSPQPECTITLHSKLCYLKNSIKNQNCFQLE